MFHRFLEQSDRIEGVSAFSLCNMKISEVEANGKMEEGLKNRENIQQRGRTWRGLGCVFAHLKGFLQQWSALCDATQSVLLQRCILLLDKCKEELLRITWR